MPHPPLLCAVRVHHPARPIPATALTLPVPGVYRRPSGAAASTVPACGARRREAVPDPPRRT